jgi:putative peptidoglycan lipid II flippase
LMGPMILGLTATQINTLADDMIAWWFSGAEDKGQFFEFFGRQIRYPMWRGSVSYLYYAQRLYQLPLGIFGISLATAIFPVMSADAARKDFGALCKTVSRSLRATLFVAAPATVGLILVARPFISAFFQHGQFTADDTAMVAKTLAFYALGLCGYFTQQILGRAFYSLLDSKTPMRTALMAVCANVVLNLTLIWLLGQAGLACATAICSYLQVLVLIAVLRRRLGAGIFDGVGKTALKTAIATVLMTGVGGGVLMLCSRLPVGARFDVLTLFLTVPTAAAAYWVAARWLDMETLSMVTGIRRKRAGQPPVNEDS